MRRGIAFRTALRLVVVVVVVVVVACLFKDAVVGRRNEEEEVGGLNIFIEVRPELCGITPIIDLRLVDDEE